MIKAIAFDLGGCLIRENDIKMTPQEEILEKELGNLNSDKKYFSWAAQTLSLSKGEITTILSNLLPRLYSLRENGIFEKILENYPHMIFAIASNHISLVKKSLKYLGIWEKCKIILISGDCGYEKPQEGFYQLLVGKLGFGANEILFVDDLKENIEGARKVGLETLHYNRENHLSESILSYIKSIK